MVLAVSHLSKLVTPDGFWVASASPFFEGPKKGRKNAFSCKGDWWV